MSCTSLTMCDWGHSVLMGQWVPLNHEVCSVFQGMCVCVFLTFPPLVLFYCEFVKQETSQFKLGLYPYNIERSILCVCV